MISRFNLSEIGQRDCHLCSEGARFLTIPEVVKVVPIP